MAARKPAPQQQPKTLMEMHDALVRIRPSRDAPLEQWQAYHHRSERCTPRSPRSIGDTITRPSTGPNES